MRTNPHVSNMVAAAAQLGAFLHVANDNGTSLIAGRLLPGSPFATSEIAVFDFTDGGRIVSSAQVVFEINPPRADGPVGA